VKPLQSGDPRRVGRYQLLGRLGAGGMGQVFLGQSPGGRLVAVKLIRAELAADREFRARFAREVAAARHVSGMFTAAVVDADPEAPQPWLVTAYVAGPSLADAVDGQGPLPLASVLTLAAGLAEGLGAIHAEGMVHRDLKPSNVLLASDGPRIIDFGISRAADTTALTRANFVVGSPGFMSPEQARGEEAGPASDIFSLGAVLTFAAVGEGPFGAGAATELLYRVVHDLPDTRQLPGQIRPLVERCLAKDPRWRPTTDQLLSDLGTIDSGTDWLPPPVAQTLVGFAKPVPAAPPEATVPSPREPPAQASPAQASPAQQPPATEPSAAEPPTPAAAEPSAGPAAVAAGPGALAAGPGALAAEPGVAPSAGPGASPNSPPPEDFLDHLFRKEPARKRAGAGHVPSITAPLEWRPEPAPPRRGWRWPGRVLAAGTLVVVLAVAGLAAVALTSRGDSGGRPTPPASSAVAGPEAVVKAYFAAINTRSWRRVWNLGGKNFSHTYHEMIAGYRGTSRDVLTHIAAHGDRVSVRFAAHHTNGVVETYRASFLVRNGVITAGHATLLTTG
jgi:protein kinase-like protein